jgi:S-adenosylmethionine hydrolase
MSHVITLLTDFGTCDSYVAQMKGVILRIAPNCQIVDATHGIAPQDIKLGARALSDYAMLYPAGTVHVAVVDPGVGTDRRVIAAQIQDQQFVLPDNGLLSLLATEFGLRAAVSVERREFFQPSVSRTFHGRDIMASVAAHLVSGLSLDKLGPRVDKLVQLAPEQPILSRSSARAEIIGVDHFGNAITNIPAGWLEGVRGAGHLVLEALGNQKRVEIVETYGQRPVGSLVVLVGSLGRVELAMVGGNAARQLGLKTAVELVLRAE